MQNKNYSYGNYIYTEMRYFFYLSGGYIFCYFYKGVPY